MDNNQSGVILPDPPRVLYLRIAELEAQVHLERQRANSAEAKCNVLIAMFEYIDSHAAGGPGIAPSEVARQAVTQNVPKL